MMNLAIQGYIAVATLVLLLGLALVRAGVLKGQGIKAIYFGNIDKKDFLIPPFALFYFYTIFAAAFHWPSVTTWAFFLSAALSWLGAFLCVAGVSLMVWSLISFGKSFRIGIDTDHAGSLMTTGAFGVSRNPIYVAFWISLLGQFLVFPSWIPLAYLAIGTWLLHRQVLREEEFMARHYQGEFAAYVKRVRRYL